MATIYSLPTQKKVDKLEAKKNFLLVKANKLKGKLDKQKKNNQGTLNKLNATFLFNQKLEEYVSHPGDVLNKARLFDDNLATNSVSAAKVIPILVDFAAKIEELLDNMRSLFDSLGPEGNQEVLLENVRDISLETGNILSLTGWRREAVPMETPSKPAQLGPSEPTKETKEEEPLCQTESESTPQQPIAKVVTTTREIRTNDMVEHLLERIQGRHN